MTTTPKIPTLEEVQNALKFHLEWADRLRTIESGLLSSTSSWSAYQQQMVSTVMTPGMSLPLTIEMRKAGGSGAAIVAHSTINGVVKSKAVLIQEALSAPRPIWQSANDIKEYMEGQTRRVIDMKSVSPILTSLKNDTVLVRRDMLVALASRLSGVVPNENPPPSASPVNGGETGAATPTEKILPPWAKS